MSHDLGLVADVPLKPGVGLAVIWAAFGPFADVYNTALASDRVPEGTGELDLVGQDDVVSIGEAGDLRINLSCSGMGHGTWPVAVSALIDRIEALAAGPGYFELWDYDVSASNVDECVVVRFVGPDERARRVAQLNYGLSLARCWIEPLVGSETVDAVREDLLAKV